MLQTLTSFFRRPTYSYFNPAIFIVLCLPSLLIFASSALAATPVISSIIVGNLLTNSATVSWTTDVPSDTQIEYGTTTAYGSSTTLNSALVTTHSQSITGLQANQQYNYRVKSRDASGDLAMSANRTFTTPLGTTTPGASTDSANSNTINTTRFTTVAGGKVGSLSVHVGAVDASPSNRSYQLAIYTASGSTPGTLIASTGTGTLTANTWNTLPITATLAPNTSYFIAYNTNGSSSTVNNMHYTSGGTSGWKTSGQAFGTWPTTFGGFTGQSVTFSLYATFVSDTTPPAVSIIDPLDQATVSGQVTVTAAADDENMSHVQFKLDGNNLGAPDTTAPYSVSWDTTNLFDGSQTLTAVATDVAGNATTSAPITVTTNNPAKVMLTQPTAGQSIEATSFTAIYTRAGDWTTGQHVHFRLDGGPTKMDLNSDGDQSYIFGDVPSGNHTLEFIVADGSHVEIAGSGGTVSFTTTAPDATPPTVSIMTPTDGATVQNTISVTANATDDASVLGVQFYLDGTALGPEDTSAPYSASWNTTTATNGSHTLTARARDTINQTISAPVIVTVQNIDPRAVLGEWGPVADWPLVAVHATLFHTGDILMWDAWDTPVTNAKLWTPTTNTWVNVPLSIPNSELFCAGQATGSNGQLVVMGGHSDSGTLGTKTVYMFDPVLAKTAQNPASAWVRKQDMNFARWYPSVTQMADNRMVTFSGQSVSGTFVNTPEIFNPATNTVTQLPFTTPELAEIQYPQTSLLPNGKIMAISSEHGKIMLYDPANSTWVQAGAGGTGITQRPYGVWTSFAPGKYLITGGGLTFNDYHDMPDDPNAVASQPTTRVLDMTSGSPVWSDGGDMHHGRSFHNVTMLPTGNALAVGGATIVSDFARVNQSTVTAEMWDPATTSWSEVAAPAKPRMYHSVSVLLPDGRVLSAGGGRLSPATDQLNAQIYSPPYMFQGPRPTITSAPGSAAHNSTMDFVTPNAANISKVTMSTLASVTHTADWNQHFMELQFTQNGDTLTINTPANTNLAPENYYMVFIVDANGVPSEAKIIKLGNPDVAAPVISGVQATNITNNSATISWNTDELADTQVDYGTTTAYGSSTPLDGASVVLHSQNLTGLAPNTTYHYQVKSRDSSGNQTTSTDFTFTTSASGPPSSGLVAAYHFNEGTGNTVTDVSGNNNLGTISQAAWYTAGKYGKALAFDGTNDYVSVPDSASLDLTNGMTLEAWVRPTVNSGWRTVMMKENGSELAYGMYARSSSGSTNRPSGWLRLSSGGSSKSVTSNTALTLNTWSHMALTYDGTTMRLYVNGVQKATQTVGGAMAVSSSPLKFGGNAMWGEYFAGQIDEIRVYNRALSSNEIQNDMNTAIAQP